MKAMRKPVLVDAWRFNGFGAAWPEGLPAAEKQTPEAKGPLRNVGGVLILMTSVGPVPVRQGDWVVLGPDGWVVRAHAAFIANYEPAEG